MCCFLHIKFENHASSSIRAAKAAYKAVILHDHGCCGSVYETRTEAETGMKTVKVCTDTKHSDRFDD